MEKMNLCKGQSLCDDGSDMDMCNSSEDEDLCPPLADWMKCSTDNKCFPKKDRCMGDPICQDGSDSSVCAINYESIIDCHLELVQDFLKPTFS